MEFVFLSEEIGSEERLRNDLFCVEWAVIGQMSNFCSSRSDGERKKTNSSRAATLRVALSMRQRVADEAGGDERRRNEDRSPVEHGVLD